MIKTKIVQLQECLRIDEMHGNIVKVNPIINWTFDETWKYVKSNNCPYNKLLDQGYPSIGCEPCTETNQDR